jgi:hypothetical protein
MRAQFIVEVDWDEKDFPADFKTPGHIGARIRELLDPNSPPNSSPNGPAVAPNDAGYAEHLGSRPFDQANQEPEDDWVAADHTDDENAAHDREVVVPAQRDQSTDADPRHDDKGRVLHDARGYGVMVNSVNVTLKSVT